MVEHVARAHDVGAAQPAGRPALSLMLLALAGGPVAWNAQLLANYALASYPCFPGPTPRTHPLPGWEREWVVLLLINLAAIAVTVACVLIGAYGWRWIARCRADGQADAHGVPATRALALGAILFGTVFFGATVFTLIAMALAPPCWG